MSLDCRSEQAATRSKAPRVLDDGDVVDGRYEILRQIGEGGWATIYLARQTLVDRLVAIKVLSLVGQGNLETLRERFSQEARAAARVKHPHIVTIHDVGFVGSRGERPYIVMEHLEGHDLDTELEHNGPMGLDRALRLVLPCLQALGAGHMAGIVHRDLKPSNLFLTHPGTGAEKMVVLDFGVAQVDAGTTRITQKGELFGTPAYLAPEWIRDQKSSSAIDVYQMGLIVVEMLTGRPVVDAQQPYDCLAMHVSGDLAVPDAVRNGPLWPVLARALATDPVDRYADCTAFYEAMLTASAGLITLPTLSGDFSLDSISLELKAVSAAAALAGESGRTTHPMMRSAAGLISTDAEVLAGDELPTRRSSTWALVGIMAALCIIVGVVWATSDSDADSDRVADVNATEIGESEARAAEPEPEPEATETEASATLAAGPTEAATAGVVVGQSPSPETSGMLVHIDSRPTGAVVNLGDRELGVTPLEVQLPQGELELSFQRRGYRSTRRTISVQEGLRVTQRLRKRETNDARQQRGIPDEPEHEDRLPVLP